MTLACPKLYDYGYKTLRRPLRGRRRVLGFGFYLG